MRDGSNYEEVTALATLAVLSAAAWHRQYTAESDAQGGPGLLVHLTKTLMAVISAANAAGVQEVILGALGCGAFDDPPRVVGPALAIALRQGSPGMVQAVPPSPSHTPSPKWLDLGVPFETWWGWFRILTHQGGNSSFQDLFFWYLR